MLRTEKRVYFHLVTLFPQACESYFSASIVGRAIQEKRIVVSYYNPRDYTDDPHRRVDRRPYGGGPGMVLEPESVLRAVQKALGKKDRKKVKIIFFEPHGTLFDTPYAEKCAKKYTDIIMICGRYEGVDARVKKALRAEGVSIGAYTLTGGELPAMVVVDAVSRRLAGVLGSSESVEEHRVLAGKAVPRSQNTPFGKS
jgi:tRNA (guanine37-N1)-methyltransferase